MYEQFTHNYESDPFAEDTIKAGEELMNIISEEHRKVRQTLTEPTDMTHSSKKAWATILRLCILKLCNNSRKAKQHYNTTANQVTHQLLPNGRKPNNQLKARFDRKQYYNDPGFTRPFN